MSLSATKIRDSLTVLFSNLCTFSLILYYIILFESVFYIISIVDKLWRHPKRTNKTTIYGDLIDEHIPAAQYRAEVNSEPVECSVCLSKFEEGVVIRELQCSHFFHKECVDKWLQQDSPTCPMCRKTVISKEIVCQSW
ncbi:hypothetical protein C5167_017678 [Papaver somniferum]|uniref:RING-type domain-containing protein n=1 Tax=Papaver somniferum TaxID=3469 RepID=A0A4Y7IP45_PAPSO|nr:hypothetical protein C5167_017678 [Papaver somniferum]